MRWKEFISDKEDNDIQITPPVFLQEKSNLPPNGGTPLQNFLIGIKNELRGTHLNNVRPNITKDEAEALNTLIKLQKECKIVIKPCNKGAGIIICNNDDYVTSCEKYLNSKSMEDHPHYSPITERDLEIAKSKIEQNIKKGTEHTTKYSPRM
jgi:hypothetical protein